MDRPEGSFDDQDAGDDRRGVDREKGEKDPHAPYLGGLAVRVEKGRDVNRGQPACFTDDEGSHDGHDRAGRDEGETAGGQVRRGLCRQPARHLNDHAGHGQEAVGKCHAGEDHVSGGSVEPELQSHASAADIVSPNTASDRNRRVARSRLTGS